MVMDLEDKFNVDGTVGAWLKSEAYHKVEEKLKMTTKWIIMAGWAPEDGAKSIRQGLKIKELTLCSRLRTGRR